MDYFSRKSLSKYLMNTIDFNKHDVDIFKVGYSKFIEMRFLSICFQMRSVFLFKIAIYLYADRPVSTLIPLQLKNRL
jgi:hypothetical protein